MELEEGYLLIHNYRKLFGIEVRGLDATSESETEKDCNPTPPQPLFDLAVDIPSSDNDDLLTSSSHIFVFRSEIYVAKGGLNSVPCVLRQNAVQMADFCTIYKVDLHNWNIYYPSFHSLPVLPTPFAPCFLGNLGDDIYCLVYQQLEGFWVLRSRPSSFLMWESVPSPPYPLSIQDGSWVYTEYPFDSRCVVIGNKLLFLFQPMLEHAYLLYSFNPKIGQWESAQRVWSAFRVEPNIDYHFFPSTTMTIPGLHGIIGLHCNIYDYGRRMMIHAMMMDSDGVVFRYQRLNPFTATRKTLSIKSCFMGYSVTDLGNGMACAMVSFYRDGHEVLCLSVFLLTPAAEEVEHSLCDVGAEEVEHFECDIGAAEAPPKAMAMEAKMFNIRVLVERTFNLDGFKFEDFHNLKSFLFKPGTGRVADVELLGSMRNIQRNVIQHNVPGVCGNVQPAATAGAASRASCSRECAS